jgi:hypothetical protein
MMSKKLVKPGFASKPFATEVSAAKVFRSLSE